jgi:hypothetical protein
MRAVEIDCQKSRDGCTPTEARVAVYLVWRLYREWRLYQLWLDGFGPASTPDRWPVEWCMGLDRLVARFEVWESRYSEMMACYHHYEPVQFEWHWPDELLERYLRLFEARCDRAEGRQVSVNNSRIGRERRLAA